MRSPALQTTSSSNFSLKAPVWRQDKKQNKKRSSPKKPSDAAAAPRNVTRQAWPGAPQAARVRRVPTAAPSPAPLVPGPPHLVRVR